MYKTQLVFFFVGEQVDEGDPECEVAGRGPQQRDGRAVYLPLAQP